MNNNELYLDSIIAQVARIPRDAALAVGQHIFHAVVEQTRVDSGQAALNWHFQPFFGDFNALGQEMLWGYGTIAPTSPAGYKWSKVDNTEGVFLYQFEYMMNQLSFAPDKISGVAIYNPISPGFAGFSPGTDEYYAQIAFEKLDIEAITQDALATVEASYAI